MEHLKQHTHTQTVTHGDTHLMTTDVEYYLDDDYKFIDSNMKKTTKNASLSEFLSQMCIVYTLVDIFHCLPLHTF